MSVSELLEAQAWIVLAYFAFVNGFYLLMLMVAAREMVVSARLERFEQRWRVLGSSAAPTISVIAPAYGEERTIAASTKALLALNYPNLEVIVVVDGSPDGTLEVLQTTFQMHEVPLAVDARLPTQPVRHIYRSIRQPNLTVVDKENGGKADALNAGVNVSTGELVCAIDADTIIEVDALQRMVRPFLIRDGVVAAGGTIRVANGSEVAHGRIIRPRAPKGPLPGFQAVEYMRAFLIGRLGWNRLGGNLIVSGAFGLFRSEAILSIGGYRHDTVGEDVELVARLRVEGLRTGTPSRVEFVPDPVAWTEVPADLRSLGRQRDRWHRGLADTLWRHRSAMLRPSMGPLGLVVLPYFLFVELLAPVVEIIGLVTLLIAIPLGLVDPTFALLFLLLAYGIGLALSVLTLMVEEIRFHRYDSNLGRLRMLLWAILEPLGYRQLTVLWRIRGLINWARGRSDWGRMERTGFGTSELGPDAETDTA